MSESINSNNEQTVRYLSHAFSQATMSLGNKNTAGTDLHSYQVEFCYMVSDITRGPQYMVPKVVSRVNRLISEIKNS